MEKIQALQKLFDTVDEATDELVQLQQELVRIQSVNTGAPESGISQVRLVTQKELSMKTAMSPKERPLATLNEKTLSIVNN